MSGWDLSMICVSQASWTYTHRQSVWTHVFYSIVFPAYHSQRAPEPEPFSITTGGPSRQPRQPTPDRDKKDYSYTYHACFMLPTHQPSSVFLIPTTHQPPKTKTENHRKTHNPPNPPKPQAPLPAPPAPAPPPPPPAAVFPTSPSTLAAIASSTIAVYPSIAVTNPSTSATASCTLSEARCMVPTAPCTVATNPASTHDADAADGLQDAMTGVKEGIRVV